MAGKLKEVFSEYKPIISYTRKYVNYHGRVQEDVIEISLGSVAYWNYGLLVVDMATTSLSKHERIYTERNVKTKELAVRKTIAIIDGFIRELSESPQFQDDTRTDEEVLAAHKDDDDRYS